MVNLGQVDSQSVSVPEDEAPMPDSGETPPGSVSMKSGPLILGDFLIRFDEMVADGRGKRGPLSVP